MNSTFDDWSPTAVVFDCDGLLVDTEPCWTIAEVAVFAKRGLVFGPTEKARFIGNSSATVGAMMAEIFDEPCNGDAIGDELLDAAYEAIEAGAKPMAGALELVQLASSKVSIAVASNSPRELLDMALKRGGFSDAFDVSVAGDEVAHPKPHPEIYATACMHLGVGSQTALAFEDSLTGLRSASDARLRTVGVPTLSYTDVPATYLIKSLTDGDLIEWVRGWPDALRDV